MKMKKSKNFEPISAEVTKVTTIRFGGEEVVEKIVDGLMSENLDEETIQRVADGIFNRN